MAKDNPKGIPIKKRKENLCSSLCDIERFLNKFTRSIKYVNIFKNLK